MFVDFDGTISPIVADPATARPLPGVLEVLEAMAPRFGLVAVVSGRPAGFLAEYLAVPGLQRWGSYGLERVTADGRVRVDPGAERWRPVVHDVVLRATREAPPGVNVEDKGISITLHCRQAPEQAAWANDFAAREQTRTGLVAHRAKMSVELRPPVTMDKGMVIGGAVAEYALTAVCVLGDDLGDVSAFRALDTVTFPIRVAVRSAEAPPELIERADVVVDGPAGALAFLRQF